MAKFSSRGPTVFGRPVGGLNYSDIIKNGWPEKPIPMNWGLEINRKVIPAIEAKPILDAAQAACPRSLSDRSRTELFETIDRYYIARWADISATQASELEKTLHEIDGACARFQEAVEIYGQASILAWDRLENIEPGTLKKDDFYRMLSMFRSRSHRALTSVREVLPTARSGVIDPIQNWDKFVSGLINVFYLNNWNVQISKSKGAGEGVGKRHPSIFVNFAWAIISHLPPEVRDHASSEWTLADALSKSRARSNKERCR